MIVLNRKLLQKANKNTAVEYTLNVSRCVYAFNPDEPVKIQSCRIGVSDWIQFQSTGFFNRENFKEGLNCRVNKHAFEANVYEQMFIHIATNEKGMKQGFSQPSGAQTPSKCRLLWGKQLKQFRPRVLLVLKAISCRHK